MTDLNKHFVLYGNCIPVKGAKRSLICDLQNGKYHFITNHLYRILKNELNQNMVQLYDHYGEINKAILDEYFTFLIENQLGFFDDEPQLFPRLDLTYDSSSLLTNAQIDIDSTTFNKQKFEDIIHELDAMNCLCIEIRSFSSVSESIIRHILDTTQDSRIREIRFIVPYQATIAEVFKEDLIYKHQRINLITFYNSKKQYSEKIKGVIVSYLESTLDSSKCGQICPLSFTINVENFTESVNFNNCLNKKVAIDINGNIKNCGSQEGSFGNINQMSLSEAIHNQKFQKLWKIKKDDIEICKDCEFRYICTDCRIFKNDKNNEYSKPSKCTYDPYTASWD